MPANHSETEVTRDVAVLDCGAGRVVCLECRDDGDWTKYHPEPELFDGRLKCPACEPFGRTPCPQIIHDWAYGPEKVGDLHLLTSEHAHELMWSIFSGEPFTRVLNVLNTEEYMQGLPKNAQGRRLFAFRQTAS